MASISPASVSTAPVVLTPTSFKQIDSPIKSSNRISETKSSNRISEAVKRVFEWFSAYFGSKDGHFFSGLTRGLAALFGRVSHIETGYERTVRRKLDKEELGQCLVFNAMTAFVHTHDSEKYLQPFGIDCVDLQNRLSPETQAKLQEIGFEVKNGALLNIQKAIKLVLLKSECGNYYLGFGDAGAVKRFGQDNNLGESCSDSDKRARMAVAAQLTIGNDDLLSSCSLAAQLLISDLQNDPNLNLTKENTTFIGQCYGGLLSAYSALDTGHKAFTMNAVSLGAQAQAKLGVKLTKAKELVTNVFIQGDWTQTLTIIKIADWFFSRLGFKTPGCFGKKFEVSNCHKYSFSARHIFSFDLILGNLGCKKRASLQSLGDEALSKIRQSNFDAFTQIQ